MVTSGLRVSHLPSDEELGTEWGSWERGRGQRGAFTAAPPIPRAEVRENEKLHSVATAITPPMSGLDRDPSQTRARTSFPASFWWEERGEDDGMRLRRPKSSESSELSGHSNPDPSLFLSNLQMSFNSCPSTPTPSFLWLFPVRPRGDLNQFL